MNGIHLRLALSQQGECLCLKVRKSPFPLQCLFLYQEIVALNCRISLIKKYISHESGLKQPKLRRKILVSSLKASDIERGQK